MDHSKNRFNPPLKSTLATKPDEEPSPNTVIEPELNVGIIVLAAGSSSRMGQSKQLLLIKGEPLLLHSTKTALASGAKHVVVVLGANEQPHQEIILDLSISIVANHYWKSGVGSSIKTGMSTLIKKFPETNAIILMVCDQPAINAHHLRMLIQKYKESKGPIVASAYSDTVGVPALFGRSFFSNILMIRDDQGAKKIIQQFAAQVKTVDFPEGLYDLDTAEDYQNFLERK